MVKKDDIQKKVYLDADQPVKKRVENLLSLMTMDEKIAQLSGIWVYEVLEGKKFSDDKANALVPILIAFVFFATYLISGITMGGVKE